VKYCGHGSVFCMRVKCQLWVSSIVIKNGLILILNTQYICKIQLHVQPLIDVQSSNPCHRHLSLRSVLFTNSQLVSNSQIYVLFQILKSGAQFSNLWSFLNFSNRHPMKSMTYALKLTNKWAIDLKIWKGHQLKIPLNRTVIWDNDISGGRVWFYHI
jgi:hypothetical protein